MAPPLAAALVEVAAAFRDAADPWWVIGSAAVRLHGVDTTVADIDVLASSGDAARVIAAWAGTVVRGEASTRFRSTPFARLTGGVMAIEVMGGLQVASGGAWHPVQPQTRIWRDGVPLPDRDDLIAILRAFGRDKDMQRAARLSTHGPG